MNKRAEASLWMTVSVHAAVQAASFVDVPTGDQTSVLEKVVQAQDEAHGEDLRLARGNNNTRISKTQWGAH